MFTSYSANTKNYFVLQSTLLLTIDWFFWRWLLTIWFFWRWGSNRIFSLYGTAKVSSHSLRSPQGQIASSHIFNLQILLLPRQRALLWSAFLFIFPLPLTENIIVDKRFKMTQLWLVGSLLRLTIREHCFDKKTTEKFTLLLEVYGERILIE